MEMAQKILAVHKKSFRNSKMSKKVLKTEIMRAKEKTRNSMIEMVGDRSSNVVKTSDDMRLVVKKDRQNQGSISAIHSRNLSKKKESFGSGFRASRYLIRSSFN